ncbi:antibiotic biosynthesis monooxygenase family protein [Chelativorans sp. YIM 93263]|uniref:antibiotic biosynthesis monooxygenase family protein n=1 Tax=Chelativorans sp. YIM 93263 TaxID=2906648 RepID=UPI002379BAFB|nr:antibiotic biosynthesis monooxygenase [Chelativorans sp. YIM 93263]
MIAVIFEVEPAAGKRDAYLGVAAELRPLLDGIDGFISIERFQSLSHPDRVLSLSFWRDEEAVKTWRNMEEHRAAQSAGRSGIFENYRLRIAHVMRDYGMRERAQAPEDSRCVHDRSRPHALPISMPVAKTSAPPSTT